MTYLSFLNCILRKEIATHTNLVVFGQNISAGSYLGGLTAGLSVPPESRIINTINAENSLVGFGFGLALSGTNAIFFMRQIDFLLLTTDQLVNTYNIIRNNPAGLPGSFTIMTTVIDQGYEGPQSSSNNLGDFCSLARIDAFTVTNKRDIEAIIPAQLVSPGFRIIAASPRLYKTDLLEPPLAYRSPTGNLFQYQEGNDTTIICFNLSFPYGYALAQAMQTKGLHPSLFSVNIPVPIKWNVILESVKKTKKLVIFDDSKSMNCSYYALLAEARLRFNLQKEIIITRHLGSDWLTPNSDQLEIDYQKVIKDIV
ncbi:MAG: Pyruvate dehydrogenase E1 component subunit beta [Parcubacteria group bacterium Gr01-1014_17]|nr:MAG: Pyruvate dehydrogenase E1 component subunit beta [Parcubacteria group bacterium Gr01-1014_17]